MPVVYYERNIDRPSCSHYCGRHRRLLGYGSRSTPNRSASGSEAVTTGLHLAFTFCRRGDFPDDSPARQTLQGAFRWCVRRYLSARHRAGRPRLTLRRVALTDANTGVGGLRYLTLIRTGTAGTAQTAQPAPVLLGSIAAHFVRPAAWPGLPGGARSSAGRGGLHDNKN